MNCRETLKAAINFRTFFRYSRIVDRQMRKKIFIFIFFVFPLLTFTLEVKADEVAEAEEVSEDEATSNATEYLATLQKFLSDNNDTDEIPTVVS